MDNIPVDIEFVLKNLNFKSEAAKMKAGIKGVSSTAQVEADKMSRAFKRVAAGVGVYFSVGFLKQFAGEVVNVRGEMQQLNIAFETMLDSKSKADKMMADVVDMAMKTPFTMMDVTTNVKQLMSMGIATDKVMSTMRSLGDVAAGVSVPLQRVAINYGQVATLGKLQGRELHDFAMAGIPLVDELAKNLGVAKDEIQGMISAGQIGFADVEKAFQTMSGEGGKFYNLMEKQNASLTGQVSNLRDKLDLMFNSMGKKNEGFIYGSIDAAAKLVENYEDVIAVLKAVAVGYGVYKAALIAVAIVENYRKTSLITETIAGMYKTITVTRQLTAAQWASAKAQGALNTVMKANPYVIGIAAVATFVTLLVTMGGEAKKTEEYIDELNKSIDALGKQAETDKLIKKYDELKEKSNKTKKEQEELNTTISKLGDLFPGVVTEVDNYGKAISLAREEMEKLNEETRENERILAKKSLNENIKLRDEKIAQRDRLRNEINTGKTQGGIGASEFSLGYTVENSFTADSKIAIKKREELKAITKEINDLNSAITKGKENILLIEDVDAEKALAPYKELFGEVSTLTKAQAKKTKNELKKLLELPFDKEVIAVIYKQIDKLEQQLAKPTHSQQVATATKELADAQKELDKMREKGSIATVKQIKEQEKNVKSLQDELKTLTGEKTKNTTKKETYEKELKDKKEAYENYNTAVKQYSKEWADENFKLLLKSGRDFKEYLQNQLHEYSANSKKMIAIAAAAEAAKIKLTQKLLTAKAPFDKSANETPLRLEESKLFANMKHPDEQKKLDPNLLFDTAQMFDDIAVKIGDSNSELAEFMSGIATATRDAGNLIEGIISRNPFQAMAGAVGLIVDLFAGMTTDAERYANLIQLANLRLEHQADILKNTKPGDFANELKKGYDLALEKQKVLEQQAAGFELKFKKNSFLKWETYIYKSKSLDDLRKILYDSNEIEKLIAQGWTAKNLDEAKQLVADYDEAVKKAEELRDIVENALTGSTYTNLVDTIAAAFLEGKSSIADFADTFEELMKQAIIQSFKMNFLEKEIKDWYEKFYKAADSGGELTEAEILGLRKDFNDIITKGNDKMKALIDASGLNFSNSAQKEGLTGAIQSLTEETGGMIYGQLMAIRVDIKNILATTHENEDIVQQRLLYLSEIAQNTSHNYKLNSIDERLEKLNTMIDQKL